MLNAPPADDDVVAQAKARQAERDRVRLEREAQEAREAEADLEIIRAAELKRIALIKEELKPLRADLETATAERNKQNAIMAALQVKIGDLEKKLPPVKTMSEGVVVSTQRAALSPVRNAIVEIRRIDCKQRTIHGRLVFVLKDNPDTVVDLPSQTCMTIAEWAQKLG